MIVMRGRLATIGELFFDEPLPADPKVDLIRCVQRSSPLPGARCVPFDTRAIDLRTSLEEIISGADEVTRYEIRRAEKSDGLDEERWDRVEDSVAEELCDFYDRWTAPLAGRRISRVRIGAHAVSGALHMSCVSREGRRVVWHAYHRAPARARLLYSTSAHTSRGGVDRALVSRANRLLHWRDIVHFREAGLAVYDLGGWYGGRADHKVKGIDRFKASLGGTVIREFNCAVPVTARGRVALLVEGSIERIRSLARSAG